MNKIIYIILITILSISVLGATGYYTYPQFISASIDKTNLDITIDGYILNYDNETNTNSATYSITMRNYVINNGSVMIITPKKISYNIEQNDIDDFKKCRFEGYTRNQCKTNLINTKIKPYILYKINETISLLQDEQGKIGFQLTNSEVYNELIGMNIGVLE